MAEAWTEAIRRKDSPAWQPLPWQVNPFTDCSLALLFTGGAGGGKSRLAAEMLHTFLQANKNAMGLMLRKTRQSMTNSTVLFFEREIVHGDRRMQHFPSKHRFEYSNGSILAYGGMQDEEQREQVRSIGQAGGVDMVWLEEANRFTEADYNEVLARLRGTAGPYNQIILTTNPSAPSHWIHRRLMNDKQAAVYQSFARDNLYNPPTYLTTLGMLTGMERARLLEGRWAQAEGIVYAEFDDSNITDEEPDKERPIELAVDDGYVDPRAILFIQRTGTRILVFDELYHSRHLGETCVGEVVERCKQNGWPLPELACGSPEAKDLQQRFRMANIPYRFMAHKVVEGIKVVRKLICDGQGVRSLQVHRRCKNFISEFTEGYQYPPEGTKSDDEKPIDGSDHCADALRYWTWLRARR